MNYLSTFIHIFGWGCMLWGHTQTARAQNTFEKGYIVSATKDTIRGFIDYRNWEFSPSEVAFKPEQTNKVVTYTAKDIRSFYMDKNRETYDAYDLKLLEVEQNLTYQTAPYTYLQKQLFIQRLWSNGITFLYAVSLKEDNRTRFWMKKNDEMFELEHYRYKRAFQYDSHDITVSEYGNQLKIVTQDAPDFSEKTPGYFSASLIKYLTHYNQKLPGAEPQYLYTAEKHWFYAGLSGGIDLLTPGTNLKEMHPFVGVSGRMNLPRNFHNSFIKVGVFFSPNVKSYNDVTWRFENSSMKSLELTAGKYFGKSNVQPFFSAGLGVYTTRRQSVAALFPTLGVSYKKSLELDVSRFADAFFVFKSHSSSFLIPPRISLNYYIKF